MAPKPIQIHVSLPSFLLLIIPVAAYTWQYSNKQPEIAEDTETSIRENYPHIVSHYKAHRPAMVKTIHDVVHKRVDLEQQAKIDELLRAGKGGPPEALRDPYVDPALYGTEEGSNAKLLFEQQKAQALEEKKLQPKKLKKKKKKKKKKADEEAAAVAAVAAEQETGKSLKPSVVGHIDVGTVAAVSVVGAVAILALSLLGGRSRP